MTKKKDDQGLRKNADHLSSVYKEQKEKAGRSRSYGAERARECRVRKTDRRRNLDAAEATATRQQPSRGIYHRSLYLPLALSFSHLTFRVSSLAGYSIVSRNRQVKIRKFLNSRANVHLPDGEINSGFLNYIEMIVCAFI